MRALKEKKKRNQEIYRLYHEGGLTYRAIGKKFKLSATRVMAIYKREAAKIERALRVQK